MAHRDLQLAATIARHPTLASSKLGDGISAIRHLGSPLPGCFGSGVGVEAAFYRPRVNQ